MGGRRRRHQHHPQAAPAPAPAEAAAPACHCHTRTDRLVVITAIVCATALLATWLLTQASREQAQAQVDAAHSRREAAAALAAIHHVSSGPLAADAAKSLERLAELMAWAEQMLRAAPDNRHSLLANAKAGVGYYAGYTAFDCLVRLLFGGAFPSPGKLWKRLWGAAWSATQAALRLVGCLLPAPWIVPHFPS